MDTYEATNAVYSRIQAIDPENAYKIIAFILLQDQAEKEMIRLAFGPDNLIHSVINVAKSELGISSNTSSALNSSSSPPPFSPLSNPISISRPSHGFHPSSPSSPSVWSVDSNRSPSYAAVVNGAGSLNGSSSSPLGSSRLQDQNFPFLDDPLELPPNNFEFTGQSHDPAISPGRRSGSFPENDGNFQRRSFSANEPSLYFPEGICKNGGFVDNSSAIVGSPCKVDAFEHCQLGLMRSNIAQQQRLAAAQYMAGVNLNLPYNRSAAATLMMGEELRKLNRSRMGINDFSGMGCGDVNPASTQIYLTFPADSTFKEEDVSNYFSMYGPVQDVRIPYQQKRMFGFVSFVYPETVKIILAKGNPHFVCDSRVLVKPYKEKGKLPEKKRQQQQLDRYEFSSCGSPFGLDCGEPFEMHVGPRMYHGNQEILSREKLEQEADWQHALELQSRRLMNLQLDLNNHRRWLQNAPVGSPPYSLNHHVHQDSFLRFQGFKAKLSCRMHNTTGNPIGSPTGQVQEEVNTTSAGSNGVNNVDSPMLKAPDTHDSPVHVLPESLFASPTKFASEERSAYTAKPIDAETPRQSENRVCTDNAKAKKETESEDTVDQSCTDKNPKQPT